MQKIKQVLQRLPPEDHQQLLSEVVAWEQSRESILDFVPRISPRYARPNHLAPIANLFERVRRRERVNAVVSLPPRHGKTEFILHAIARLLADDPYWQIGYTTYSAEVAESKSLLARQYAVAAGVQLHDGKNTLSEWRTPVGGGVLAVGTGGSLTSQGVGLLICDDPFKNRVEAESPLIRERVFDWWTSTATTRVEPGGSRIVIHARWHSDDLAGRLEDSTDEHWEVIKLPAIDEHGNALWPERWPVEELRLKECAVGPYDWASLFQQNPRPRGGKVFQREAARYQTPAIDNARIILFVDGAGTENTWSDHTAVSAQAFIGNDPATMTSDILEVEQHQTTPEQSAEWLYQFQQRRGGGTMWIESTRDGKRIRQLMLALNPSLNIVEVPPLGDKFTRAQPFAAAWNQGRVRLPEQAPWVAPVLNQASKFTGVGSQKDDIIDSLSGGWNVALRVTPYTSTPRGQSARSHRR